MMAHAIAACMRSMPGTPSRFLKKNYYFTAPYAAHLFLFAPWFLPSVNIGSFSEGFFDQNLLAVCVSSRQLNIRKDWLPYVYFLKLFLVKMLR
jgi:hypothetical protein